MIKKLLMIFVGLISIVALWLFSGLTLDAIANVQAKEVVRQTLARAHSGSELTQNIVNPGIITVTAVGEWEPAGLSTEQIVALAIAPTDPNILYAGTGSYIFKTTNGAGSWSQIHFGFAAYSFAIHPTNANIVYAGRFGYEVLKTVNGGVTWVELPSIGASTHTALAIDPLSPNTVYAGVDAGWGVYKTTNGGSGWTEMISSIDVTSLAINSTNPSVVYAGTENYYDTAGGVYKSANSGTSWTKVMTHTQVNALAVDPVNGNIVYAGTEGNGVFKSIDGGANWTGINTGLTYNVIRALAVDPRYPNVIYAGTWEGGVFKSIDGGANWSNFSAGLTNTYITTLALDPTGAGILYAGTEGTGVFKVALAPPPPPPGSSYAKVVAENGQPVTGVQIYRNGSLAPGATDAAGNLILTGVQPGDKLVALSPVYTQPTVRRPPAGWAYRVHQTSLPVKNDGSLQPFTVVTSTGPQTLTVKASNALVLFNLLISIEWDAKDDYIGEISEAAQSASHYLYDLTDGQMAFGQVAIYDNGQYWADADIQISTSNIVRPHAFIGGLTSSDKAHVIRVGRGWNGYSGDQGAWNLPDGYRTLTHEFGHYALYLYDEYFAYIFDQNGKLTGEASALCVGPQNRNPATDSTNASAMDWQYDSSELSARGVPGLWSSRCEQTAQWQLNPTPNIYTDPGESTWETLARKYADTANPARWQLITPAQRGSIMAGPSSLPHNILAVPLVTENNSGISGQPRPLIVYGPDGQGYWGAIVSLYKGDGRVIAQGFTNGNGQLKVYGVEAADTIRAASFDGGLYGSVTVGSETNLSLSLAPVGGLTAQANGIPHMRVIAQPGQNPAQIDLLISLRNFGPNANPAILVTQPGSEIGYAPPLSYSASEGTYNGAISFSATERGTGRIRVLGNIQMQSTYRLQEVVNSQSHNIFSDDGNLSLYLKLDSLPGSKVYFIIMPPGAVPGPLPSGLVLVGNVYDVTASGGVVPLQQPAILSLSYDGALVNPKAPPPDGLSLYRWNPNNQVWQVIPSELDEEHKTVVASITNLGTYALLASPGSWSESAYPVFLPIIVKQ